MIKASQSLYSRCIYFTSNALARKTEKLAQESWSKVDLAPSHAYLLMLALEQPGIQPSVISAQLQLTPSTVTRLIAKLEQKKLLVRTTEGKITNVYPSPKGKALLPRLKMCQDEFYKRYSKMLGEEESARLSSSMGKAADRMNF